MKNLRYISFVLITALLFALLGACAGSSVDPISATTSAVTQNNLTTESTESSSISSISSIITAQSETQSTVLPSKTKQSTTKEKQTVQSSTTKPLGLPPANFLGQDDLSKNVFAAELIAYFMENYDFFQQFASSFLKKYGMPLYDDFTVYCDSGEIVIKAPKEMDGTLIGRAPTALDSALEKQAKMFFEAMGNEYFLRIGSTTTSFHSDYAADGSYPVLTFAFLRYKILVYSPEYEPPEYAGFAGEWIHVKGDWYYELIPG
jgi:hypothetical protein